MTQPKNRASNKGRSPGAGASPTGSDTAKQNYTAIQYGNDKGGVGFGIIHQPADVTAAAMLYTGDATHTLFLDGDGPRKGWTSSISPGNFQVECGSANNAKNESLHLCAKKGNITIIALDGKIRLEADDIELHARGTKSDSGNIRLTASENVEIDAKKFLATAKVNYKIASPGTGEVCANSILKIYASIIKGVDDSVAQKDAKNGGQNYQQDCSKV